MGGCDKWNPYYLSQKIAMEFRKLTADYQGYSFVIEEDNKEVGAYLYVWRDGKGLADYLQDSVELCKEFALEEYKVPLDQWIES